MYILYCNLNYILYILAQLAVSIRPQPGLDTCTQLSPKFESGNSILFPGMLLGYGCCRDIAWKLLQDVSQPQSSSDPQGSTTPAPHAASGQFPDGAAQGLQRGVPLGPAEEGLGLTRWPAHLGAESQG